MRNTFKYIRSTTNFNVFEYDNGRGEVTVVHLAKTFRNAFTQNEMEIIISTRKSENKCQCDYCLHHANV